MAYSPKQSLYFDYSAGGKRGDLISFRLRPVDPRAFEALMMPMVNPQRWGRREKIALNRLLYALGYEIHGVLHTVLSDSRQGPSVGVNIIPNHTLTRLLKASGNSALRDTGALLRSLRVRVPESGMRRIEIDFKGSPGVSLRGSGRGALPAGEVAYQLEMGHTITVTRQMRKFMIAKCRIMGVPVRARAVGSNIIVRPRPFLRESVRAGMDRFQETYLSRGGGARMLYDLYFNYQARSAPVVQFSSNAGISAPGGG